MGSYLQYRLDENSDVFRMLACSEFLRQNGLLKERCRLKNIFVADTFRYEYPNGIVVMALMPGEEEVILVPKGYRYAGCFGYGGIELEMYVGGVNMKTKKFVVSIVKSIVVEAVDENMAKKLAGRYEQTGITGIGSNRVTHSEDAVMVSDYKG